MANINVDNNDESERQRYCDLFKGSWVEGEKVGSGYGYTNWSCSSIPDSKNCFKHGRKDSEFVNWRWKPHGCHLPRFDAATFLRLVHAKKLAFIGDSVSRNHMDSLLCLLSQVSLSLSFPFPTCKHFLFHLFIYSAAGGVIAIMGNCGDAFGFPFLPRTGDSNRQGNEWELVYDDS